MNKKGKAGRELSNASIGLCTGRGALLRNRQSNPGNSMGVQCDILCL